VGGISPTFSARVSAAEGPPHFIERDYSHPARLLSDEEEVERTQRSRLHSLRAAQNRVGFEPSVGGISPTFSARVSAAEGPPPCPQSGRRRRRSSTSRFFLSAASISSSATIVTLRDSSATRRKSNDLLLARSPVGGDDARPSRPDSVPLGASVDGCVGSPPTEGSNHLVRAASLRVPPAATFAPLHRQTTSRSTQDLPDPILCRSERV
jgi:hypothetical protein